MKFLFRIVSVVVLLMALVGAIVLVRNNQETRKGATANDTFSKILPDLMILNSGEEFSVNVWLNTGSNADKMTGVEFKVIYDQSKIKYLSLEPQSGYTLINDPATVSVIDSAGNSYLDIKLITMGTEIAGAVNVVKLKFQTINNGEGSMLVQQGKMMIAGQNNTWEIASNEPSNYKIGVNTAVTPTYEPFPTRQPTVEPIATVVPVGGCGWCGRECINNKMGRACIDIAPPEGMICTMDLSGACVIKPDDALPLIVPTTKLITIIPTRMPTLAPTRRPSAIPTTINPGSGACGTRCLNNTGCNNGTVCAPIWWPCAQIPTALIGKIQGDLILTQEDVSLMLQKCPEAQKILPANYDSLTQVKLPTFYGLCRNQTCVNCQCNSVTSVPTRRPTVSVIPTVKPPQGESSITSFWKKLFDGFFKNR